MDLYPQCVNNGDRKLREKKIKEEGMILPGICRCRPHLLLENNPYSQSILHFLLEHAIPAIPFVIYCPPFSDSQLPLAVRCMHFCVLLSKCKSKFTAITLS